jgi:DNA modification methylase
MKMTKIKPNPNNPRKINPESLQRLKDSVEQFPKMMKLRPIVIDQDGMILGGNMRYLALKEMGWKEIPDEWVKIADELTPDEKRRFIIADNVSGGEWDYEDLAANWDPIELENWGLELPENIFEQPEAIEDGYEIPDEIETDIQLGDLFEIGEHRLLCGDSTDSDAVAKLMNGEKADMVFTDPPYGVSYADKNRYLNSISPGNRIQIPIENDHMTLDDTKSFILLAFKQIKLILAKRSSYYITAPQGGDLLLMMMMMMNDAGLPLRHCLIWAKNNHVLGRTDYNYKHEPILYGWDNVHDFYGKGEFQFSVWNIDKPLKNDLHPTMKPVKLIENALLNSTIEGMIVVDIFLGSGSTMVAAHQLKRKCYGMEIDPKYCQVIVDRMRKLDPSIEIKRNGEHYD